MTNVQGFRFFAGFQATGATLATLQYPFLVYTTTVDSVEGAL